MYPDDHGFKEALQQARDRAAAVNRARQQQQAPDPPESGAPASGGGGKKPKDRRGSAADRAPPPQDAALAVERTAAVAGRDADDVRREAAAEMIERAERSVAAAAHYRQMPLHNRLGMGPSPGASGSLLQQLQMSDLHNRMAFDRHQERLALLGAAQQRELQGLAGGRSPWGHPGIAAMGGPGAARAHHLLDLQAEAAAEDRWRAQQGLPPLGGAAAIAAAGRGGIHPGAHPGARGGIMGLHGGPPFVSSETNSPALRGQVGEVGEHTALGSAAVAAETASELSATTPAVSSGNALFDLLATAAEDTLRKEELQKVKSPTSRDGDVSDPPTRGGTAASRGISDVRAETSRVAAPAKQTKRKKKGANEPKNPLGAFVFYQRKIMSDVFEENPCITFGEAAAECGKRWRELPDAYKQEYKDMATADKARYTRELATFKGKHDEDASAVRSPPKVKTGRGRGRPRKNEDSATASLPKRAKSAFLFFKTLEMPRVFEEFPNVTKTEASTECAARYKMIPKAGKEPYEKMAADDKLRYKKELGDTIADPSSDSKKEGASIRRPQSEDKVSSADATGIAEESNGEEMDKEITDWSPEAVKVPKQVYGAMVDSNPHYVEEEAWRYHNPPMPPSRQETSPDEQDGEKQLFTYVTHEELRPLPPPPPLPTRFPNSQFCRWSFDEDTRVLHADFRRADGNAVVTLEDEKFLLEMYEKDDITVISEGLATTLDREKWTLDYMSRVAGDEYFHKFRRFDKQDPGEAPKSKPKRSGKNRTTDDPAEDGTNHGEVDRCLSMKVKDYVAYLRCRSVALDPDRQVDKESLNFAFQDHDGKDHTIEVTKTVLYMIDFDMVKLLPTLNEDFTSSFKLREILPGGAHCMMNCVNSNGRPFMGPNMYITPPGSFTHFHQDGHGTVDSGHLCLAGYNEVVMLRRVPERHKRHAMRFLTGSYKNTKTNEHTFEALYNLPHGDGLGEKPRWPDNEAVARCNEMNYCLSRFILKPGQCVHINKGRLHAFRKLSNEQLPPTDCHSKLRRDLLMPGSRERVVGPGKPEVLCISVAWDWMFRGVTAKGINREILTSIECAALNRKYGVLSLAIPELSLMQMARTLAPKPDENVAPLGAYRESLLSFDSYSSGFETFKNGYSPSTDVICRGIFPALQYVIKQHIYAMNVAERLKSASKQRHRLSVAERPNAWENPSTFAVDPYGNTDFFCKLCNKELSNVYLHCTGCEIILSKDFNICLECHQEKRYAKPVQMHPLNNKRHSTINHIGNYTFDRASRCPCKTGPICRHCNYCAGCSCRCHTWFSLHIRLLKKGDEMRLLHRVKRQVGRQELEAAEEAEKRLSMAVKGSFDDREFGLHSMDVMVDSNFDDPEAMEELEGHGEESSQGEGSSDGREPPPPKRKSRRLGKDEAETNDDQPAGDGDVGSNEKANGSSSRDNRMQVDVSDMKVTIRYRTGEWTESERGTLRRALKEEADWESIVEKLSERGSDQVRKYAIKQFPTLAKALKERGIDRMEISAADQEKSALLQQEEQPTPEADNQVHSNGKEIVKPTSNDKTSAAETTEDEKQSDAKPILADKVESAKPSSALNDAKKAPKAAVAARSGDDDDAALAQFTTDESPRKIAGRPHQIKAAASLVAEVAHLGLAEPPPNLPMFSGKRGRPDEKKGGESDEKKEASEKKKDGESDKTKDRDADEEKYEGSVQMKLDSKPEAKSGIDDAPKPTARMRLSSGKWTEGERERLKAALDNESDMEAVETVVGTRRYPQIRSYAPRTFPELWEGFRERSKAKEEEGAKGSESDQKVAPSSNEEKATSPSVEGQDKEETKPAERRRSRRSSLSVEDDNTRDSTDEDSVDNEKDEETVSSPRPNIIAGESKLKVLARARGRRASQDLSRKRRNSATSTGSAKQADPTSSAETDPPTEDAGDSKRQKMN